MRKQRNSYQPEKASFQDYLWVLRGIRIPWLFIALIFVCVLVMTVASIGVSYFTGDMVDAQGNVPSAKLAVFALSYLAMALCVAGQTIFQEIAAQRINLGLRAKLWRKIIYTSQSSFDQDGGEALVSRVTADCDYASRLLTTLVGFASLAVSLAMVLVQMYRLSGTIFNAMMVLIPLSALVGWVYAKLRFLFAQRSQTMLARATTYLVERTRNLYLIKTENAQQKEVREGRERFREQYVMQIKTGLMEAFYACLQTVYSILSVLIPFLLGAKLVKDGVMTTGNVVTFYAVAGSAGMYFANVINAVGTIREANGALSRVILTMKQPDEQAKEGQALDVPDQDVSFEEVCFSYGEGKTVLESISCRIPKNEVTAVIGTNGSGKSTLFKLLDRLYEPQSGTLRFGNENAADYDVHSWRKAFCLVAQGSQLMEGTVRENICYGCERRVTEEELVKVAKQARVYDFVSKLPDGFDTGVAPGGSNFSGGQRQCIAIARAIMNNPDYLLLDEATSNLDAKSERIVMEALEELMRGRTTVVIAHSLATIRRADHVIVLRDGRVESSGDPKQILSTSGNHLGKVMGRRAVTI